MAIAISTILLQFGAVAGLAMGDAIRPDNSVSYNFIVAGLWLLVVSVSSSAAAGYISGRMRMTMNDAGPDEVEFRDGIHGVTAWALATVAVAAVAAITTSIGSVVASIAVSAATQLSPDQPLSPEMQAWVSNQALIIAFATAAGSALGAAAAWAASVTGGKHRNDGTSFHVIVPSLLRKK